MKVKVLGCSGGIGGKHLRTTSLRIDNDILIDAGTGVTDLSLTSLAPVGHRASLSSGISGQLLQNQTGDALGERS